VTKRGAFAVGPGRADSNLCGIADDADLAGLKLFEGSQIASAGAHPTVIGVN
jgi:hypothetical protein